MTFNFSSIFNSTFNSINNHNTPHQKYYPPPPFAKPSSFPYFPMHFYKIRLQKVIIKIFISHLIKIKTLLWRYMCVMMQRGGFLQERVPRSVLVLLVLSLL